MRYVGRPKQVEAVQWNGDKESFEELLEARMPVEIDDDVLYLWSGKDGAQGWVPVPVGSWVVRLLGEERDHWPVDPDFFDAEYEERDYR
jgi:hypothetical protein